jgi:predicted Rossmann fold flavoprotein
LLKLLLASLSIESAEKIGNITKEQRKSLVEKFCECPFEIEKIAGFNVAMCTTGGVSLNEINPKTMESKLQPGLFFAGEVLDIDGDTGGYNLQAAFSTGYLAAIS